MFLCVKNLKVEKKGKNILLTAEIIGAHATGLLLIKFKRTLHASWMTGSRLCALSSFQPKLNNIEKEKKIKKNKFDNLQNIKNNMI